MKTTFILISSYRKRYKHTQFLNVQFENATKHKIWLIAILLMTLSHVHAQQLRQTIRGKVVDQESQVPLIGATVVILGTEPLQGSSTDLNGEFVINNVLVGRHTIKISSIGYEESAIPELEVNSGKEVILNIQLKESLTQLQEIVIIADEAEKGEALNEMASVSARSFTVEETQRYAASVNDPARMVLSFAGVSSTDDGGNEIVVRGNSPRGVLWRVQGVEIPNPNHFGEEGSSSGGVTMLSANMLSTSDFYTGAFPAEYGNGYSAAFDLFLRKGNNQKREYAAQAGVLGVDFAAEGPFKKGYDGSYLVNYRYSTLGILEKLGVIPFGDAIPVFQDLAYNIYLPTKHLGTFSLWGIGGLSNQIYQDEEEGNFIYKYNMGVAGINHRYFTGSNTFLESTFSVTESLNGFDSFEFEQNRRYFDDFENSTIRGSVLVNHKFNARHTIRAGAIMSGKSFNLYQGYSDIDTASVDLDASGSTTLYQGYGQWKGRLSEKLTITAGLHFMLMELNGQSSIEPRFGLQYQVSPNRILSLGYGQHSKMEALGVYFSRYLEGATPNKNIDFMKAHHFVLGYEEAIKPDLKLKTEIYYQQLKGIPIAVEGTEDERWLAFSALNLKSGIANYPLVNDGEGHNYGIELSIEQSFNHNYYFTVTSSIYDSKYTARDGIERDTRFNGRFNANVLFGKEIYMGKNGNNVLGLNLRMLTSGGNRWTPVLLNESIEEGEAVYDYKNSYSETEGTYFRMDLRFSFRKNKENYSGIWSLDLQNATNNKNVYSKYYEEGEVKTAYQLGLLPILSYKIEF